MPYEVGHGLSYRVNVRWLIFVSSRKFVLVYLIMPLIVIFHMILILIVNITAVFCFWSLISTPGYNLGSLSGLQVYPPAMMSKGPF